MVHVDLWSKSTPLGTTPVVFCVGKSGAPRFWSICLCTALVFILLTTWGSNRFPSMAAGAEPPSDRTAPAATPPGAAPAADDLAAPQRPTAAFVDLDRSPIGPLLDERLLANLAAMWLERNAIDAVLTEQRLAHLTKASAGRRRVALGQLLKANVLVLLRTEKVGEEDVAVLVVAETAGGLRLISKRVPVAEEPVATIDLLERLVQYGIERSTEKIEEVYAVPPFYSRDLSFEYSYMSAAYAGYLEKRLSSLPGVLVVELAEANAIAREYQIADPAGVVKRPVPIYVIGEYRNVGRAADLGVSSPLLRATRTTGERERVRERSLSAARLGRGPERQITVKLHIKRGNETIAAEERTLAQREVANFLWSTLTAAVREHGGDAPASNINLEAQQLAERAEAFFKVGDWVETLALTEASLLLRPKQPEILGLAARAAARLGKRLDYCETVEESVTAIRNKRRALEHLKSLRECQPDLGLLYLACIRSAPRFYGEQSPGLKHTWPEEVVAPYQKQASEWRELLLEMARQYADAGMVDHCRSLLFLAADGWDAKRVYAEKLPLMLACDDHEDPEKFARDFLHGFVDSFEGREFLEKLRTAKDASPQLRQFAEDRWQKLVGQPQPPAKVSPAPSPNASSSGKGPPPKTTPKPALPDRQKCAVLSRVNIRLLDDELNRWPSFPFRGIRPPGGIPRAPNAPSMRGVPPMRGMPYMPGSPGVPVLRGISGCLPLDNGMDVMWQFQGVVCLMKDKGIARVVWRPRDRNTLVQSVDYDGRYVWIAAAVHRQAPEVWVVDPQDGTKWQITKDHGLPLHAFREERGGIANALVAGVAPRQAIVAGSFDRAWLAKVDFDPNGEHKVEVFHEAREIPERRTSVTKNNLDVVFVPQKMLVFTNEETSEKRVVVFRDMGHPFLVDPATLKVEISESIRQVHESDDFLRGVWYYRAPLPSDPKKIGVVSQSWPGGDLTELARDVPNIGKVFCHEGRIHLVTDHSWDRPKVDGSRLASVERIPRVLLPDMKNPRSHLTLSRFSVFRSNHYGLLASWMTPPMAPAALAEVRFEIRDMNPPPPPPANPKPAPRKNVPRYTPEPIDLLLVDEVEARLHDPYERIREASTVAISPDGSLFVTKGTTPNRDRIPEPFMVLWSAKDLQPLRVSRTRSAASPKFMPDGTQLVSQGVSARFWDLATGKHTGSISPSGTYRNYLPRWSIERSYFDPIERRMFSVGNLGYPANVRQWDFENRRPIVLESLESIVGFLPDGSLAASLRTIPRKLVAWNPDDHSYRVLWDALRGKLLAMSPEGDRLITSNDYEVVNGRYEQNQRIRLWDVRTGREIPIFDPRAVEPFYVTRLNDEMAVCAAFHRSKYEQFPKLSFELKSCAECAGQVRYWAARNLASNCRAAMVSFADGKVALQEAGDEEVIVPVEHLSAMDRRFVQEFAVFLGKPAEVDRPGTSPLPGHVNR